MNLKVKVIPRAKETTCIGFMQDGTLKIRLKATPEKGRANEELIRFLSRTLNLAKEEITLVSGFSESRKSLRMPDETKLPW